MYERKNPGIWLMYLRKSRQDNPGETIEEVLAKHEVQLQEHAVREFGRHIAEENIYREVVSGESIDDRAEIKKVLERIEDPAVIGVLVIEPQRLSRGDLEDCGRLINAFRFTHTQVCTPIMTYDFENKMDRKFFQDELLRGRDYLEYTKEILFRGRIAATKRGCYISGITPFGYNKIKVGKDYTLEPNENAAHVRSIYEWYVHEKMTPHGIATRLNKMEVPSSSGSKWQSQSAKYILQNPLYIGKISFNKKRRTPVLVDGVIVQKQLFQPVEDIIIAEGKHPAIVDIELWEAAQERFKNKPRTRPEPVPVNPFNTIMSCSCCGRAMKLQPYNDSESRYACRSKPRCYKSAKQSQVTQAVIDALEFSELPKLEALAQNGDGGEAKRLQHLITKLEKQMQEYKSQENTQFELLETGKYSMDVFEHRHSILKENMVLCQKQIREAKEKMPKNIDYAKSVSLLKDAISLLKDPTATPKRQNEALKKVVKKILYTGEKINENGPNRSQYNESNFSLRIRLVI